MTASAPVLDNLDAVAGRFAGATLEMLDECRLLRRFDTKFLLPAQDLAWVLASVSRDYRVLCVDGTRLARYRTVYHDTPDLRCYHDHRRGRRPRHKIRVRHYLDHDLSFFEIKTKRTNGETHKHRFPLLGSESDDRARARRLVGRYTALPFDDLVPSISIDYHRMTLLSIHDRERVTIDVGLDVAGAGPGLDLTGVAVLEVKQRSLQRQTSIMQALQAQRFYPQRASKYCTSLVLTRSQIPANHIRSALRAVERLQS